MKTPHPPIPIDDSKKENSDKLYEAFADYMKVGKGYSVTTIQAYRADLRELSIFLEEKFGLALFEEAGAKQVQHRSLRSWVATLIQAGLNPKSVCRKIAAAKAYFNFLKQEKLISQSPVSKLSLPKTGKRITTFLKETETNFLFSEINFDEDFEGARDKCIIELLYGCGLRRSELIGLQTKDFDFENRIIRITGKGNKTRIVPYGNHVAESIAAYKRACDEKNLNLCGHFLVKTDNQPLYENLVYRIAKKYIDLITNPSQHGPHVFRHTYATHLLNAGADLNDIKTLLGHGSLAATQVYTHNSLTKLKNVHALAHPRAEKP